VNCVLHGIGQRFNKGKSVSQSVVMLLTFILIIIIPTKDDTVAEN